MRTSRQLRHLWSSGMISACHAGGPGPIPGKCSSVFYFAPRPFLLPSSSSRSFLLSSLPRVLSCALPRSWLLASSLDALVHLFYPGKNKVVSKDTCVGCRSKPIARTPSASRSIDLQPICAPQTPFHAKAGQRCTRTLSLLCFETGHRIPAVRSNDDNSRAWLFLLALLLLGAWNTSQNRISSPALALRTREREREK